jgi:GNAT superfamily N-acetyltransferase
MSDAAKRPTDAGVLRDHSHDAIVEALERNWRASVGAFGLASGTTVRDDDEMFWFVTGLPDGALNSIMYANFAPDRVDVGIAERTRLHDTYGVPINWLVGPMSRPFDLGERLQMRGLRYLADLTPMTITLDAVTDDVPPVPGLTVERVADAAALEAWIDAERRGFEMDSALADGFGALRRGMGVGHGLPLYHLLGRLDGEPVGTSSYLLAGGIVGIHDVSTVPEARRRGVGMALTRAALREGQALGYEIAFLNPSPMGRPLYRKIGFEERCICRVYG